jgi:hypothetical protein
MRGNICSLALCMLFSIGSRGGAFPSSLFSCCSMVIVVELFLSRSLHVFLRVMSWNICSCSVRVGFSYPFSLCSCCFSQGYEMEHLLLLCSCWLFLSFLALFMLFFSGLSFLAVHVIFLRVIEVEPSAKSLLDPRTLLKHGVDPSGLLSFPSLSLSLIAGWLVAAQLAHSGHAT